MRKIDQILIAPHNLILKQLGFLADVVSEGIGSIVEYEVAKRHVRTELPDLPRIANDDAVGQVRRLLNDPDVAARGTSIEARLLEFARIPQRVNTEPTWTAFLKRAERAATNVGFSADSSAGLIGAIGELVDNVLRHSESRARGIVGYHQRPDGSFEYVVSDEGVGILTSLRTAPEFAGLRDDFEALQMAVLPGVSRFGRGHARGYGFRAVFLPLQAASGSIRLRSGRAVLEVRGMGASPDEASCRQRHPFAGVTVSVRMELRAQKSS